MVSTGLVQWYPVWVTMWLPGVVVPISRAVHSWEAILAVTAIISWHMYHVLIKERNASIFTGYMSEGMMKKNHFLEYEKIMDACRMLEDQS